MVPMIQTTQGITLFINGETHNVESSDTRYEDILAAIKGNEPNLVDVLDEILKRDLKRVQRIVSANTDIVLRNGVIYYNGTPLHNSLTARIIRMSDEGFDVQPLVNFLARLQQNPSFRVVNNLYDFLEAGQIPITPDGYFLAYKAVREDYKDIHSGTIDNSVGQVPTIPRNQVDEDPERTCSYGLHVCSWNYLPHFAHASGHVMIVKCDPADVVAIPADYNNTKMRLSRYEVVGEHTDYYTQQRQNVLADRSVTYAYSQTLQPLADDADDDFDDLDDEELDYFY